MGKMFFIGINTNSKWMDAIAVNTATLAPIIAQLHMLFVTRDLAGVLVTDNGTCFTSDEFNGYRRQHPITWLYIILQRVHFKPSRWTCRR